MRGHLHQQRFSTQAGSAPRKRRVRTWLVLGTAVFGILGLVTWSGIALLSWLFGQFPAATETGRRLAGETVTQIERQIEQVAPGLKNRSGSGFRISPENHRRAT